MIPIDEIIDYDGNRFLVTKAVMKRAREINFAGDEELKSYDKIASLSLNQIFKGDVKFILPKEHESRKE